MNRYAAEVTGITDVFLRDKPPVTNVLESFSEFVERTCTESYPRVLVAYNGSKFDIPMLVAESQRSTGGAIGLFRKLRMDYFLDPLIVGRACLDKSILHRNSNGSCSYTLGHVYRALVGQSLQGAHGALVDADAVITILTQPAFHTKLLQLFVQGPIQTNGLFNPMQLIKEIINRFKRKYTATKQLTILDMLDRVVKKQKIT